ncbi:PaaI family thioesterase [Pseudomonas oryzihabitans]|uniref:PaaI family thioesterase n=1 Tax=Pseudomonas oryzihabitans TaxID=47885 RepID=UPI0011A228D6|nr:PaaI family thioesterase [Pseudomonas psychrotolerans]
MTDTSLPSAADIQARLLKAPYHRWLGLEVLAVSADGIELTARWREDWVVNPDGGYTHGGVLAALVDLTADWALVARTGKGVPTIDLRVDYHRPARGDLRVKGTVIKHGKLVSVAEAQVFDAEGQLVASGRGVYATPAPRS